jgi:hypothetical protein
MSNKFKNSPIHDKKAIIEMMDELEPKEMIEVVDFIKSKTKPKDMKYRKKPVEIEAIQFTTNFVEIEKFCQGNFDWSDGKSDIKTLEGIMKVSIGDYIIKGVKGEFYPCKPDIFEMTYEKVD